MDLEIWTWKNFEDIKTLDGKNPKVKESSTQSITDWSCKTWKPGMLTVLAGNGGQGHRILVDKMPYRETWSWFGLSLLRDLHLRDFTLSQWLLEHSVTSISWQIDGLTQAEAFWLICVSLYNPLVVKEAWKFYMAIGLRQWICIPCIAYNLHGMLGTTTVLSPAIAINFWFW